MRSPSEAPAPSRTGKLSAQPTDEAPFAFPPQGEGGPLAVDEVPEHSEASPRSGKKDLIRPSVRTGAPSPCAGKALGALFAPRSKAKIVLR